MFILLAVPGNKRDVRTCLLGRGTCAAAKRYRAKQYQQKHICLYDNGHFVEEFRNA